MRTGPLEYMVVEFEGNHFTGEILPELRNLRDRGVVRLVDLVFIQKTADGTTSIRELSDLNSDDVTSYGPLAGDMLNLLSIDDIQDVAQRVRNNSAVAIALLEHMWEGRLQETIANAHGTVVESGLIPPADVEALLAGAAQSVGADTMATQ